MSDVRCFMVEHTGECLRYLRRFTLGGRHCQGGPALCDASALLDRAPTPFTADGHIDGTLQWPHGDPRWPAACARCGELFRDADYRQVFILETYRRVDGQPGEYVMHCNRTAFPGAPEQAPPGAMWWCDWMGEGWRGPDGHSLAVMLPDGTEWLVDGPSRGGGHWTRRGTPPDVVVSPSILSPRYHGWLGGSDGARPGWLVEC